MSDKELLLLNVLMESIPEEGLKIKDVLAAGGFGSKMNSLEKFHAHVKQEGLEHIFNTDDILDKSEYLAVNGRIQHRIFIEKMGLEINPEMETKVRSILAPYGVTDDTAIKGLAAYEIATLKLNEIVNGRVCDNSENTQTPMSQWAEELGIESEDKQHLEFLETFAEGLISASKKLKLQSQCQKDFSDRADPNQPKTQEPSTQEHGFDEREPLPSLDNSKTTIPYNP